ncbi:hypothetical protein CHLRE_06g293150v5 [Chlamydomonas reinhardtii]|uniref:Phosphoglycerate mutase n=1 Tax=Chlamydomonas reinhardtii TaxID=3055 RepID=A0A2K3DQE1_CHLRE|nr:uncharacterized protein CHLRE_06g293150v5 [Chlamydomonas reinhardtii]PNW82765.1 hypothetical protein CHLRE_06g293150v5 [Chlamydomonas reinhardtii]
MARVVFAVALLAGVLACAAATRPLQRSAVDDGDITHQLKFINKHVDKKDKHPYRTPTGLFIQERASKQLPGPGQHFSFGALVTWDVIHQTLDQLPDSKLIFLIRHGQAVSNYLSDTLGPDEWFKWETKCGYSDNATSWNLFDADLTDLGEAEADALNLMLLDSGWFKTLTAGLPARAVVSPLSRCLETATRALKDLPFTATHVEENVRETLGEDTCDARRSASDPKPGDKEKLQGVCKFEQGLRTRFPQFEFPVSPGKPGQRSGFGLLADADPLWTEDRETQGHQTKRALGFLQDLWEFAPERVVFVVTHSGFTRSVLLAAGREPYRPQNTELVPLLLQRVPQPLAEEAE